jgi:hypothetical protein
VELTTGLFLVPTLSLSRYITPLLPYAFVVCTSTSLYIHGAYVVTRQRNVLGSSNIFNGGNQVEIPTENCRPQNPLKVQLFFANEIDFIKIFTIKYFVNHFNTG